MRVSPLLGRDARTLVRATAGPAAILLLAGAAPPTASQEAALARTLVCPERLRDDAARLAQTTRFVHAYGRIVPGSRMGERMAARDRILAAKRCRPDGLQYSFPET